MKKHEMSLAEALEQFLQQSGIQKKKNISQIHAYLPDILGLTIASYIRDTQIQNNTITFQVNHPIWKQELLLRKNEICFLINEWIGSVTIEKIEIIS